MAGEEAEADILEGNFVRACSLEVLILGNTSWRVFRFNSHESAQIRLEEDEQVGDRAHPVLRAISGKDSKQAGATHRLECVQHPREGRNMWSFRDQSHALMSYIHV